MTSSLMISSSLSAYANLGKTELIFVKFGVQMPLNDIPN
jgi:hypothetical protein